MVKRTLKFPSKIRRQTRTYKYWRNTNSKKNAQKLARNVRASGGKARVLSFNEQRTGLRGLVKGKHGVYKTK